MRYLLINIDINTFINMFLLNLYTLKPKIFKKIKKTENCFFNKYIK